MNEERKVSDSELELRKRATKIKEREFEREKQRAEEALQKMKERQQWKV